MLNRRLIYRVSQAAELDQIVLLQQIAFGQEAEGVVTRTLMGSDTPTFSLVAELDNRLVGHILFTQIETCVKSVQLAPLAVDPQFRDMQIGSGLTRHGIAAVRESGYEAVFVLGDRRYYERFGFDSSIADPFDCQFQCKNFMALELVDDVLSGQSGPIIYPAVFFT